MSGISSSMMSNSGYSPRSMSSRWLLEARIGVMSGSNCPGRICRLNERTRWFHARALPMHKGQGLRVIAMRSSIEEKSLEVDGEADTATAAELGPQERDQELVYKEPSGGDKAMTSFRLAFALPWRRFKKGSVLTMKLGGKISDQLQPRFSSTLALPDITSSLRKAAYDPRVKGICVKIDPLDCGWGKIQEIKRHVELLKESGKFAIAYLERAGEKEFYLASAFKEIYAPPSASISIRGLRVNGTFLRGALERIGIEPEVRRIGNYKSAGDQLLRHDMSEYQREQLTEILDDIYSDFVSSIAGARGKTVEETEEFINKGYFDMLKLKEQGFIDDLKYEDEINDMLKARTDGKEDELRFVKLRKYRKVSEKAFGLGGKKTIAVLRTSGAIVGGSGSGNLITSESVISQLRAIKKNKRIAAVVLRVDSPGGDALASDLMWREIRKFAEEKPIIASMGDVAASGGYYMSMACQKIVAEDLTLTGSIGVVTGKFNLAELYNKIGYSKETISRGKYAQILNDSRPFSEEEAELFDHAAQFAYEQFRDKAAQSREMDVESMQAVAQGRVWSGKKAREIGLVDSNGGLCRAVNLAKESAGIDREEKVTVREISRAKGSPLNLLTSGGGSIIGILVLLLQNANNINLLTVMNEMSTESCLAYLKNVVDIIPGNLSSNDQFLLTGLANGNVLAQSPEFKVEGIFSQSLSNRQDLCKNEALFEYGNEYSIF